MQKAPETRKKHDWDWDLIEDMPHKHITVVHGLPMGPGTVVRIRQDSTVEHGFGILFAHLELMSDLGWKEVHKAAFSSSAAKSREAAINSLKDYAEYIFGGRQE